MTQNLDRRSRLRAEREPAAKWPNSYDKVMGYNQKAALYRCPVGHLTLLGAPGYLISDEGVVSPEVQCSGGVCPEVIELTLVDWNVKHMAWE